MCSTPLQSKLNRFRALILALSLAGLAAVLYSQSTNRVSGLVTDPSGAVIVGATVTATDNSTNVSSTATSNERGYYLLQLPIGLYDIKAANSGFRTSLRERVQVSVGA